MSATFTIPTALLQGATLAFTEDAPTPKAMPQRRPQRTWSPPAGKAQPVTPAVPQQGNDNSARRRARRNGWDR